MEKATDDKENLFVDTIFIRAIEITDVQDRLRYLDQVCKDDAKLRYQLSRLFANLDCVGTFLETPAFLQSEVGQGAENLLIARDLSNEQVGSFRLVEKIGAGGMGEVYLATQEAPLQRKVAIKLLREGMGRRRLWPVFGRSSKRFL